MATSGQSKTNGEQDITTMLTREHRVVAAILDKIEQLREDQQFDEIAEPFALLKSKLMAHAKGEEAAVYPRFAELSDEIKDLIGEANEEHALVHAKLTELGRIAVDMDEWKAKFTVLKELVEHHVEDEEGEIFPAVRHAMKAADAKQLADTYLAEKEQIAGKDEITSFDLDVMTKDELLAQARHKGLEGASSMTKHDLVEALAPRH
jgi:hemerythrin superfamily protein